MSNEDRTAATRPYRKRRRAEQEEQTRRRITEAAVALHGSVGPARTTISAVAARAGVQRATVYRHFPTEDALFAACSFHWMAEHPLPDVAAWAEIEDPGERLHAALDELYAWYERGAYMVEKTTRDATLVPALRPSVDGFGEWFGPAVEAVMSGRRERNARRRLVRAAIGHALAFDTWRSLAREQRLSRAEAIELMTALVAGVARG
jgi:AcrR family transcriptional regulator